MISAEKALNRIAGLSDQDVRELTVRRLAGIDTVPVDPQYFDEPSEDVIIRLLGDGTDKSVQAPVLAGCWDVYLSIWESLARLDQSQVDRGMLDTVVRVSNVVDATGHEGLKPHALSTLRFALARKDIPDVAFQAIVRAAGRFVEYGDTDQFPLWESVMRRPALAAYAFTALLKINPYSHLIIDLIDELWRGQLNHNWPVDTPFLMRKAARQRDASFIPSLLSKLRERAKPELWSAMLQSLEARPWSAAWVERLRATVEPERRQPRRTSVLTDEGLQSSQAAQRETQRACAILLSGSHRWAHDPLESVIPRCLMPVALQPLIVEMLQHLLTAGIADAVICAAGATRFLRQCLGDGAGLGVRLSYYEDWLPRGPAGCVKDAAHMHPADQFVVLDTNHPATLDLRLLLNAQMSTKAAMTVALSTYDSDTRSSDPVLRPVGAYALSSDALRYIGHAGYQDIKEQLIPRLRGQREAVLPYIVHEPVYSVATLRQYLLANSYYIHRFETCAVRGFTRVGAAFVHKTASIAVNARLVGPMVIGPGVRIDDDAIVVGPTSIGRDSVIDRRCQICRSVLWRGCHAREGSSVDAAVLTEGVTIARQASITKAIRLGLPIPPESLIIQVQDACDRAERTAASAHQADFAVEELSRRPSAPEP